MFNEAAQRLSRETLDVQLVLSYASLGEFDLLRGSHRNILDKPWTCRAERDSMHMYFKLQRAKEELVRVQVEMRRLHVHVIESEAHQRALLDDLRGQDPLLAHQLQRRRRLRVAHCLRHLRRLEAVECRGDFEGTRDPAVHLNEYALIRNALILEVGDALAVEGGEQRVLDDLADREADEEAEELEGAIAAMTSLADD